MEIKELKSLVAQKIKEYPEYKERALYELRRAIWLFESDNINIADELLNSDKKIDDRYVLPFFLGKTDRVDLSKPLEIVQIRRGGGSGLDIDTDFEPKAKEAVKQMLIEKYGQSRVMGIGTYTNVGLASGIKDILRKCEVPFKESNDFCKELDDELSFEENMENYRKNFPELYQIYNQYKAYLDMTPKIMNNKKACIPGNQLVNTINGKKEMKEISSADEIAYLDKSGNVCYTKNFKKIWSGKKDVFEIELENGKKIRATEEHLFFTNNGLKKLKDLTEKDELIEINCNKLEQIKIKSIKKVSNEDVYDIQNFEKDVFQNESNFIIDDILGHNCGQHAGGCLLLDDDVWNYIPVIHTKDGVATAFVESGSAAELDELGIIKYDFLAITVLEVISNAVDSVDEEIVKILDDDGIIKYVPRSYIDTHK